MRGHLAAAAVLLAWAQAVGQGEAEPPPLPTDMVEKEEVRLVLLDAVVTDAEGRTVPGLVREDFEIVAGGEVRPADTLDVRCHPEPLGDPSGELVAARRPAIPPVESGRRIALVFDYLHLGANQRTVTLDHARRFLEASGNSGDTWMVAAVTGGLRIEQRWTRDPGEVLATLGRMQHDITLWNGNFRHLSEKGWVGAVDLLLDALTIVPDSKAMVFFSAMRDVPLDTDFRLLAASAATSRCTIYPVDVRGLFDPYARSFGPEDG